MASLLEIRNLELTLGSFTLGELSLTLASGDYLVLLGPSGCGKTSLLRTVAGIYTADRGELFLEGEDVGRVAPHKRGMGYVAQTADLFPHMDVARNIAFGLSYLKAGRAEKRRMFDRMVDFFGIGALLPRSPATLSGGESKRVGLARSLVVGPRVLLLDEPLSMLDHNARAEMLAVLKRIHDELGTAAIHVTHDREEAWALEGHCAVMRDGRIEQVGSVSELFREPRSRFVAEFLGGTNIFPARFVSERGEWKALLGWTQFGLAGPVAFSRGYVQIRPESLALASEQDREAIEGTIRSVAERGVYVEVAVEAAAGIVLRAHLITRDGSGLRVGERIRLRCISPPHPIEDDGDA